MNEDDHRLKLSCGKTLSGHPPLRPDRWLRDLAGLPSAARPADDYGSGGAVSELEARVADLLGKEAGLFVIKGMIAQTAALKAYAERSGTANVARHPLSHMEVDEGGALPRVGGLMPIRVGRFAPFSVADLKSITDPLAAVIVELPLRRGAYALPPLEELRAISAHCRECNIPLHFDGARLWEAAAGYGIGLAELAALADSVYVSFYKGLGAPAGAMLCGSSSFIEAVKAWKGRMGGNVYTAFPYALGALGGIQTHLPRMTDYVARSRALAARLGGDLIVNPAEPHVNAFHLLFPGTPSELIEQNRHFAEEHGIWLFNAFGDAPLVGHATAEVVIGACSDAWDTSEAAEWIAAFAASGR